MRLPATLFILASVVPGMVRAQPGEAVGRVTDTTGAPLANVSVTISGPLLAFPRTFFTSPRGDYRITGLPPGTYRVTFHGDALWGEAGRELRVGSRVPAALDVKLEGREPAGSAAGPGAALVGRNAGRKAFSGSLRSTLADRRLQWTNLAPALAEQGVGFGNPVRRATEVGVEMGAAVWGGRLSIFASADRSDTNVGVIGFYTTECSGRDGRPVPGAAGRVECLHADTRREDRATARLQLRWGDGHRVGLLWGLSETRRPNRGASSHDRVEHTNRQFDLGHAQPIQLRYDVPVAERLSFEATYAFSDGSFMLDFQRPDLAGVQGAYDRYSLVEWRSGVQTEHRRPSHQAALVGRYAASRAGGHEITFGLEFADRRARRIDRTGGGAVAVFDSRGGPPRSYQARVVRDGETGHAERGWSAHVQESFRRGRLTVEGGLRLDVEDDRALPAVIPANPVLPDLLPQVRFAGADSGVVYRDLSPRLALSWDVSRDGRAVLRAGFRRSRAVGNDTSAPLQAAGPTRLTYWWDDCDGDGFVRAGELDIARGLAAAPSANYDPARPSAVRTPATVDSRLHSVTTEEAVLGVERQLTRRLSMRASYTWRWLHRMQDAYRVEDDGSAVSSSSFSPTSWTPAVCPSNASCPAVTFYERMHRLPTRTVLRNDGRYARQHGVEVVVHKRQARGWMLDLALAWRRARLFFPEATCDYTDPTNIAMWDGTEYSMPGPRWTATVSAGVTLPWGLSGAGKVSGRGGLPFVRVIASPNRGALGSTNVLTARYGSERYPSTAIIDCRIERPARAGRLSLTPAVHVFNAANAGPVLRRNAVQNSASANGVTRIEPPRALRLDLRLSW